MALRYVSLKPTEAERHLGNDVTFKWLNTFTVFTAVQNPFPSLVTVLAGEAARGTITQGAGNMQSAYEPAPQVSPSYRFATRELLPATLQATYPGKADRYEWWEAFWRRVCRVLPLLHHAPWAKHVGKGQGERTTTRATELAAFSPDRVAAAGKSGIFFDRGETRDGARVAREVDVAG